MMLYSHEPNEKEIKSKETERDVDEFSQRLGLGEAAISSSGDGSDNDRFFSFIREMHLEEAREFRREGYNSQEPGVDPELVAQLRNEVDRARASISVVHTRIDGPFGTAWLQEQLRQIAYFTDQLTDDRMQVWVAYVLSGKSREGSGWNKSNAQSLVRRLESTLRTLIHVVRTLRAVDDHSTPEKRRKMLVTEFMDAFSSCEENTVVQARENMLADAAGSAAWDSLMQTRAAAWEDGAFGAMREATQQEAKKAREKENAEELLRESQQFFGDIASYLEALSHDFKTAWVHLNPTVPPLTIPQVKNDKVAAPSLQSTPLSQKVKHALTKGGVTAGVVRAEVNKALFWGKGYLSGDHTLKDRFQARYMPERYVAAAAKKREQVIDDSIIRSILWRWQQPAIKVEYASSALLLKIKELKKINALFSSDTVAQTSTDEPEGRDIPARQSGEEELLTRVRKWVQDGIEQENPENQRAAKLKVLNHLLDADIENARKLAERLGKTEESVLNMLRRQRFSVLKMLPAIPSLTAVDKLLPDIARDLAASVAALEEALRAADNPGRNFSEAGRLAREALLLATTVNKNISAASAELTGIILDDHSRGARLGRHWATLARERNPGNWVPPDAKEVLSSLKKNGLSEGVLSHTDPEGYLFATRLAGEFENARNDELRLPMSPEQYTALEKGLVEYIVKWGQRKVSSGVTRLVFELSFDAVTFSFKPVQLAFKVVKASIKIPYKINQVNKHIMPGQDKPYKAIYGMLEKKLKQLGFSLVMSPVPGVVRSGAGLATTAAAGAYNQYVEKSDNTFSAIYERVTEGRKSEQIKMTSPAGMLADALIIDTPIRAGINVANFAIKSSANKIHNIDNIALEKRKELLEHNSEDITGIDSTYNNDNVNMRVKRSGRREGVKVGEFDKSLIDEMKNQYSGESVKSERGKRGTVVVKNPTVKSKWSDELKRIQRERGEQTVSNIDRDILKDEFLYNGSQSGTKSSREVYKNALLHHRQKLHLFNNRIIQKYLDYRLVIECYDVCVNGGGASEVSDPRRKLVDGIFELFKVLKNKYYDQPSVDGAMSKFESLLDKNRYDGIFKTTHVYFLLKNMRGNDTEKEIRLNLINSHLPQNNKIDNFTGREMDILAVLNDIQSKHIKACDIVHSVPNLKNKLSINNKKRTTLFSDARIIAAQLYDKNKDISLDADREGWLKRYDEISHKRDDGTYELMHLESVINSLQYKYADFSPEHSRRQSGIELLSYLIQRKTRFLHIQHTESTSYTQFKSRDELEYKDKEYYKQFDEYNGWNESGSQMQGVIRNLRLSESELQENIEDVKILSYVYDKYGEQSAPGRVIVIKRKGGGAIVISNISFKMHTSRISDEEYKRLKPILEGEDRNVSNYKKDREFRSKGGWGYSSAIRYQSTSDKDYDPNLQKPHSDACELLTGMSEYDLLKTFGLGRRKEDFYPAAFLNGLPGQDTVSSLKGKALVDVIFDSLVIENKAAAAYLRTALHSLRGWEEFAYRLIPFYETIHRSSTDKEFEVSIGSVTLDLLNLASVAFPTVKAASAVAALRASRVSVILKSGLRGSELLIALSKEMGHFGIDASKIFGVAALELANPLPINLSKKFVSLSPSNKALKIPKVESITDIKNAWLHWGKDPSFIQGMKNSNGVYSLSGHHYIEMDKKIFSVRYDKIDNVWRVHPDSDMTLGYRIAVIRNSEGNWISCSSADEINKQKFNKYTRNGLLPPMVGGAITNPGWRNMTPEDAEGTLKYYLDLRKHGAARKWADNKNIPEYLKLSEQAIHNWEAAKKGNAFSGMLDTRTGMTYLVPATHRRNVKGQVEWEWEQLKNQWFHKKYHLKKGNEVPYSDRKLRNLDHGKAAAYLDGVEKPLMNADPFTAFKNMQETSSNWLGFFIHSDSLTGEVVLNFKSAQLNGPNILFPKLPIDKLFSPGKNSSTNVTSNVDINKMVMLPKEIQEKILIAISSLPSKKG